MNPGDTSRNKFRGELIAGLPPKAELYVCQIYQYSAGHLSMSIQAAYEPNRIYIGFNGVRYFSGSTMWIGSNFQIEPPEKCLAILRKINLTKLTDEDITEYFRLFTIDSPSGEIKIIAHPAPSIFTDEPL